ncbi:MAG: MarR family winged helix-turn-helix transcriptional regulator [Tahibacter sp.]
MYATLGIDFQQRWFGVLNQLALNGPATVGELASVLEITHVSVSQTRQSLERAGIIVSERDTADSRRRRLALTDAGHRLVVQLKPLWRAFEAAAMELTREADQLIASLDRLDNALEEQSMFERIMQHVTSGTAALNPTFPGSRQISS